MIAVLALAGCAVAERHDFAQYIANNKPLAEAGTIKWSDYYKGAYEKLSAMGSKPGVGQSMLVVNSMIDAALSYESGKISKEQFDSIQREAKARSVESDARDKAIQAQYWGQALQNYGNTVYRPAQAVPAPINCTTTHMPGLPTSTTTCN